MNVVALRARTYRQRQKAGRSVFAIEAADVDLFEALKASPFPPDDDSHEAICRSLQAVVEFWIEAEK
jgi:hypothetical protein